MSCGGLQCFREPLGVGKVTGTPMEIDHALILCRLVGLSHRSVQYLCFERRKLVSLAQPDDYREIWKTRHCLTLHSLSHRWRNFASFVNYFTLSNQTQRVYSVCKS